MIIKNKKNHTIQSSLARGIIESNVSIVTGYPGWPATSIMEELLKNGDDFHIEWSVNEKQAVALAAGLSLVGERAAVVMKHVGVNVASDAIIAIALNGQQKGGLVFFVGDDPGGTNSQNEQDTRTYSNLFNIPILEPSSSSEARQMVEKAFILSEKFKIPFVIRFINLLEKDEESANISSLLKKEKKKERQRVSNYKQFNSGTVSEKHRKLREKLKNVSKEIYSLNYDRVLTGEANKSKHAIVTSGPISHIVMNEVYQYINYKKDHKIIKIFKVSTVNPLPMIKLKDFLHQASDILVIEEGSPWIERHLLGLIHSKQRILGKLSGDIPYEGCLHISDLDQAILNLFVENKSVFKELKEEFRGRKGITFSRWQNVQHYPVKICHKAFSKATQLIRKNVVAEEDTGLRWQNVQHCPVRDCHQALKAAIQLIRKNVIIIGDLGCVNQGNYKTYNTIDASFCMGVSASVAAGISLSGYYGKVIAIMGDSSFFHSGIQALINAVCHKANITFLIFDNQTTGETGRQANPGTGFDIKGKQNIQMKTEDFVKACQVNKYKVLDANKVEQNSNYISSFLEMKGVNVLILRAPCPENCIPG